MHVSDGPVRFVTVIGLTFRLHLRHLAVLATLLDFVLPFLLEARVTPGSGCTS